MGHFFGDPDGPNKVHSSQANIEILKYCNITTLDYWNVLQLAQTFLKGCLVKTAWQIMAKSANIGFLSAPSYEHIQ